jgi:lipopolysaccharide/colanic/teichoic acid biosynthesis glycosyltransferase
MYLSTRYVVDRVLALVMLIVISPVMVAIAMAMAWSQGPPILFRQQRVGRHGRLFTILKFRTMVEDAEQIGGGYLLEDENLITPMGTWLRRTNLDELPQLINIVRGDMAFVGPRPGLVEHFRRYTSFQRRRLEILPGVTGLAQVTYGVDAPWSKRIVLDVEYIDSANPILDASILIRTGIRVITDRNTRWYQPRNDVDDLG